MNIAQIQRELIALWNELRGGNIAADAAQLRLAVLRAMLEAIDIERRMNAARTWK